jgi:hypothetical protein
VADGSLTPEQAELIRKKDGFGLEMTPEGEVSAILPNRYQPVTLLPGQWDRLLEHEKDIRAFCRDNRRVLEQRWNKRMGITRQHR